MADDTNDTQPPLIPMSDDELRDAARMMAAKQGELEDLKALHEEQKEEMRAAEKKLAGEISAIASTIRTQGR